MQELLTGKTRLNRDSLDSRMNMMKEIEKESRKSDNPINQGSDNFHHGDITRRIIGCAMRVHSTLGNGFQEVVYQRALAIEMKYDGLQFEREKEMPIFYRSENIGTRRVDFFVEGAIMVELKALINLDDVHLAQAMNYLEAYAMEIGLLINFGSKSLEFKRVHNNKHPDNSGKKAQP
jgi:GxxExxY protein